jgi:hypothetical protein
VPANSSSPAPPVDHGHNVLAVLAFDEVNLLNFRHLTKASFEPLQQILGDRFFELSHRA